MNAAIIGYGKMGREIERLLVERGHGVGLIGRRRQPRRPRRGASARHRRGARIHDARNGLRQHPRLHRRRYAGRKRHDGWTDRLDELKTRCKERGGAFFYASNYSLGVNLLFRLNRQLAEMVGRVGGYDVRIEEVHHTQKKDAPSGTAITLAEEIIGHIGTKERWVNRPAADPSELAISSIREGAVPGIHTVTYTSADDVLTLRHEILNRRTLALGAVIAAEFLNGKRGVYTMDDLLK